MISEFSRRFVGKLAWFSAAGLAGGPSLAQATGSTSGAFPKGFVWGTATSAYQVEGAVGDDGRGPSIWDTFTRRPGTIADGSNADRANEHYHRYRDDVRLMKDLGVGAYRFSIAWPRVLPDGTGTPNPRGLDFYHRLVDELLANGIEPFATLYHWDLPQSLQDRFGGWQSRETSAAFAGYAAHVARHLGDRVRNIFTINECGRFVDFGYGMGIDAPGLKLPRGEVNQVRHHVALAHGLAVQAIRASGHAGIRVGMAENIATCIPATAAPADVRAAETATREMNAGFLNVILEGRYTDAYLAWAGKDAPRFTEADLKVISTPNDFVGLNIYSPQFYIAAADVPAGFIILPFPKSFPHMSSEWLRIGPEAMYWAPLLAARTWKIDTIYITENGTSADDELQPDGRIHDLDRVMYLRNYLVQLQRAVAEGTPVRGYFLWSLMDNFEWIFGLDKRFGLYHVDFASQVRRPKLSASFYRDVIGRNAITG